MSVYKILKFPHVLLRKKSTPVERFTPDLADFSRKMTDTMYAHEGIGLAAPQVGVLKRFMVVDVKPYLENPDLKDWHGRISYSVAGAERPLEFPLALVNPVVARHEGEIEFPYDGCLSFPGVSRGGTKRHTWIELHAKTVTGEDVVIACDGIMSICLQHELDHLEGVLFIDRLDAKPDPQEVVDDIHDAEDDPATRKRMRKLKLVDAQKETFSFL